MYLTHPTPPKNKINQSYEGGPAGANVGIIKHAAVAKKKRCVCIFILCV
jgi:hypothetical protein